MADLIATRMTTLATPRQMVVTAAIQTPATPKATPWSEAIEAQGVVRRRAT